MRLLTPEAPESAAPLMGTDTSLLCAITPATAAAANTALASAPSSSMISGPTSTTRSLLIFFACSVICVTLSFAPPTTAMRSRRVFDAFSTLSLRLWCTSADALSHTTMPTSSSSPSAANALA